MPSLALNFLADRHAVRPTPRLALAIDHELTEEGPRDTLHHRGAQQYDFISSDTHLEVLPEYVAIELREHLEVEHIMFATDFPHIECEWPNTRPTLDRLTASLAPAEKYSIVAGNVIDYFQLDPAKFVVRGEDEGRTEIMGTTRDGNYPH